MISRLLRRALFAKSVLENAIHSPSSKESAEDKIKFIFGDVEFQWDGSLRGDMGAVSENGMRFFLFHCEWLVWLQKVTLYEQIRWLL